MTNWRRRTSLAALCATAITSFGLGSSQAGEPAPAALKLLKKTGLDLPSTAPFDIAFERNLMVAGMVASGLSGVDPSDNQTTASGIATFRLLRRSPYIREEGFLRCDNNGDLAVWRRWVFVAVWNVVNGPQNTHESRRCNNTNDSTGKEGLRIIDIGDPSRPKQVGFIESVCGVGYVTLVPMDGKVYIYNPTSCDETLDNPVLTGGYGEMEVYRFYPKHPERSQIVNKPSVLPMTACETITVVRVRRIGVCMYGNRFVLLDISDPAQPEVIGDPTVVSEANYLSWASFTWDGQHLLLGDSFYTARLGTCSGEDRDGGVFVYNVEDTTAPQRVSEWHAPTTLQDEEGCGVGNIQALPTKDGSSLFSVAYGGVYILDLTDPANPKAVASYTPGAKVHYYTAPWYNGRIYVSDLWNDSDNIHLLQVPRSIRSNLLWFFPRLNVQTLISADIARP